jgi:hypothetical protein
LSRKTGAAEHGFSDQPATLKTSGAVCCCPAGRSRQVAAIPNEIPDRSKGFLQLALIGAERRLTFLAEASRLRFLGLGLPWNPPARRLILKDSLENLHLSRRGFCGLAATGFLGGAAAAAGFKNGFNPNSTSTDERKKKMSNALGYDDTPLIPGSQYKVHDSTRPQPRIVTPGTESAQDRPGKAPSDAIVLFDGTDLTAWECKDGDAKWRVENGYMEVVPGTGSIRTREGIGDCQLHIEFAAPSAVKGDSQGRGNSGIFMMAQYEIQVLDGYNNPTYADGMTGGIYGEYPPLVNACRKPGEWQMYDIIWEGPRFDGDTVTRPASVTVILNGVVLHHKKELFGPTSHRKVRLFEPHPEKAPLELQDHKDLVRYRNIWYRPLRGYDE